MAPIGETIEDVQPDVTPPWSNDQPMALSDLTAVTGNWVSGEASGPVVQAGRIDKVEQHFAHSSAEFRVMCFGIMPPRAGAFQNRADFAAELDSVARSVTPAVSGAGSQVVVGMGGVGKTQLAAEHARTLWRRGELDMLMWVTATSRDAIVSAYAQAAVVMMSATPELDADQVAGLWLAWLGSTGYRWLIVLDDVQHPSHLKGLWPPHTPSGRVVVTTRRRDAALNGDGRRIVQVGLFTPKESFAFLVERLSTRPAQIEGAAQLAEQLGHLPLALAQAAAYIADRTALTCASYLLRWTHRNSRLSSLLPSTGELPDEHRQTIATTWSLSIDLADQLQPVGLARPLIEIASMLDPNGIPDTVFTAPATLAHLATRLGRRVDADDAIDALSCLQRLSLISYNPDSPQRAVRIHALVQRAIAETGTPDQRDNLARAVADALLEVWPQIDRDATFAAVLRRNTLALHTHVEAPLWTPDLHDVLFRAGLSLGEAGQLRDAIDHYSQLRSTAEHRLGADHPDTLSTRHYLARWRGQAGDARGAATALELLASDCERVLGADHLTTLITRHNCASWQGEAGDVSTAATAFQQVLADCERVLGTDHPQTLTARHNLAHWRAEAGDAHGAATALEQLVADRERILGTDHPQTLSARHSLAHRQGEAGNVKGAATAFHQVLTDCERVLGTDHPDTLAARHYLALWQGEAGDAQGAATALKQLVADRERVLGPEHPQTLNARHSLAHWQGQAGRLKGAATAFQQILADCERVLGIDHPQTQAARDSLTHWRAETRDAERVGLEKSKQT